MWPAAALLVQVLCSEAELRSDGDVEEAWRV